LYITIFNVVPEVGEDYCKSFGGHLLVIKDEKEFRSIQRKGLQILSENDPYALLC
jgi:hypothetical protein